MSNFTREYTYADGRSIPAGRCVIPDSYVTTFRIPKQILCCSAGACPGLTSSEVKQRIQAKYKVLKIGSVNGIIWVTTQSLFALNSYSIQDLLNGEIEQPLVEKTKERVIGGSRKA